MTDIFAALDTGLILPFALLLFAVWRQSIWVWLVLIVFAVMLEWPQALPLAWRKLSDDDQSRIVAYWVLMALPVVAIRLHRARKGLHNEL